MKIIDYGTNKEISNVGIELKVSEAKELLDSLKEILMRDVDGDHAHISNEDYSKEITIWLEYREEAE